MPFLDAARALITAGHDADAILEMYRPDASSWELARTAPNCCPAECS
jgi:hypothetical protein